MSNNKIFVSIASLEDPSLVDTIRNCLNKAKNPQNIIFGISLQYEVAPYLDDFINQCRIIKHDLPDFENNHGAGIIEIRNAIKKLHKDEDYYLQIDAHTDFAENWDDILIHDINEFDNKTIISKQISSKNNKEETITDCVWSDSTPIITASPITNISLIEKNLINKNYFLNYNLAGGFIFTKSKWLYEVPLNNYHKYIYEELEPTVISYCFGYDIVSPLNKRQVIFAGTDSKHVGEIDEKWWHIEKININDQSSWLYYKKWIKDSEEMVNEVESLLINGQNSFMNINNCVRNVVDFYSTIGLGKEYKQYFARIKGGAHKNTTWVVGHNTKNHLLKYREKRSDKYFKGDIEKDGFE